MNNMKKFKPLYILIIVIIFVSTLCIPVFAQENEYADSDIVSSLIQDNNEEIKESTILESNNHDELENALSINEKLFSIYGTWTSVIGIILILVTIFGIVAPLYANSQINKKIEHSSEKIKKEYEKELQKNIAVNNALMLSATKDYWASNNILSEVIKKDSDNPYLHLLIGRNTFLQYETQESFPELSAEALEEIEEAIQHYIFVANNTSTDETYYSLGAVFPDSIIHELCMLTSTLINYSIENPHTHYHKITNQVIKAIEKILSIKNFDDIANEDQTNVHIMNYIILNHDLAKSYQHFGDIRAKAQYEYVLKLYSISSELDYSDNIDECMPFILK